MRFPRLLHWTLAVVVALATRLSGAGDRGGADDPASADVPKGPSKPKRIARAAFFALPLLAISTVVPARGADEETSDSDLYHAAMEFSFLAATLVKCGGEIDCLYAGESGDLLRIVEKRNRPAVHMVFATASFGGATPILPQGTIVRGGIPNVVATIGLRYEGHFTGRFRLAFEASYGHVFWRSESETGAANHSHYPHYTAEFSVPVWFRERSPVEKVVYRTDTLWESGDYRSIRWFAMLLRMPKSLQVHLLIRHSGGFLSSPAVGGLFFDPSVTAGVRLQKEFNSILGYEVRKAAHPDGPREEFVKDRYEIYAAWIAARSHLVYPSVGVVVGGELVYPMRHTGLRMGVELDFGYAASYDRVAPYLDIEPPGGSGYAAAMVYFGFSPLCQPRWEYTQREHMVGPEVRP